MPRSVVRRCLIAGLHKELFTIERVNGRGCGHCDLPSAYVFLAEGRLGGMYRAMKALHLAVLAAVTLSGCASKGGPETPCATINREIGDNSQAITGVAVRRGTVDKADVPFWVPGGTKAVSVITSRQTAKIEKLQAEQSTMRADREQRCRPQGAG